MGRQHSDQSGGYTNKYAHASIHVTLSMPFISNTAYASPITHMKSRLPVCVVTLVLLFHGDDASEHMENGKDADVAE